MKASSLATAETLLEGLISQLTQTKEDVGKLRQLNVEGLTKILAIARSVQRGCSCDYDYRCGNCSQIVSLLFAVAQYDAGFDSATTDKTVK